MTEDHPEFDVVTSEDSDDTDKRLVDETLLQNACHPVVVGLRTDPVNTDDAGADNTSLRSDVLRQSTQQAHKLELIGRIAGGIAHDFNNLLTIINGYAEILLPLCEPDSPQHMGISAIRDAGERAAALTTQLLAFSRKALVEPRVLDLNRLIADAEKLLARLIGEDILLTVRLAPGLGRIQADPGQLDQVLLNLAVNARDAMPMGGRLIFETRNVAVQAGDAEDASSLPPGPYVELQVRDTGVGMTPDVLANIFEPFYTTKAPGHGTGLGLAVVHGIVRQAGGSIVVSSQPQAGTTFQLWFPRVDEPILTDVSVPADAADHRGKVILLVEDDAAVRTLMKLALESRSYDVIEASAGEDAMQAIQESGRTVDLLISDVIMPGMSCQELTMALKSRFPELLVLLISGYAEKGILNAEVRTLADAFLPKPLTPLGLSRKVSELFAERASKG